MARTTRDTRARACACTRQPDGNSCIFRALMHVPKYACMNLTTGHSSSKRRSTFERRHVVREAHVRLPRLQLRERRVRCVRRRPPTHGPSMPRRAGGLVPRRTNSMRNRMSACAQRRNDRGEVGLHASFRMQCILSDEDLHAGARSQDDVSVASEQIRPWDRAAMRTSPSVVNGLARACASSHAE